MPQVEKGIKKKVLENRKGETRTITRGWNLQIQGQYKDMLPAPGSGHSSLLPADERGSKACSTPHTVWNMAVGTGVTQVVLKKCTSTKLYFRCPREDYYLAPVENHMTETDIHTRQTAVKGCPKKGGREHLDKNNSLSS